MMHAVTTERQGKMSANLLAERLCANLASRRRTPGQLNLANAGEMV